MAILAECPTCRRKQTPKNKVCKCGESLDQAKKSRRVRYWITYRLPGGKQRKEAVASFADLNPYSIEDARTAEAKRTVQKKERRLLEILPEYNMTFSELAEWYLELKKVKNKAYYPTLKINLNSFNAEFGSMLVSNIKPAELENYQSRRKAAGYSDSYVDQEVGAARTMVNKGFDNDLVGGESVKAFKRVGKLLKRNSNARDRILTLDQFQRIMEKLPRHTKSIPATGFYTGMRKGEILSLTWDKIDMKNRVIKLEATDTKDKEPRSIPIADGLYDTLKAIPRGIHDNHVFQYKGKPVKDIRAGLKRACRDAGIPYGRFVKDGFVFHDLRHSFNTHMRKAGVPESVIMEITGHSTREMFDRYNTIDQEDRQQAVAQMEGYFSSVAQNVAHECISDKKEVGSS